MAYLGVTHGHCAAVCRSQRLAVVHCGEVPHKEVNTRSGIQEWNNLGHLGGCLPQTASFSDKVPFELSLKV